MLPKGARTILNETKEGPNSLEIETDEIAEFFGIQLPLGRARSHFKARIANEDEVRKQLIGLTDEEETITVQVVPYDDNSVTTEYLDWMHGDGNPSSDWES